MDATVLIAKADQRRLERQRRLAEPACDHVPVHGLSRCATMPAARITPVRTGMLLRLMCMMWSSLPRCTVLHRTGAGVRYPGLAPALRWMASQTASQGSKGPSQASTHY